MSEIKPDHLVADAERVRRDDGFLIATVWEEYPSQDRLPGESWMQMMRRTEEARDAAKDQAKVRALRFAASDAMLTALQEVLATPGLQSGLQAMCAAAIARATGRDVADVIKGGCEMSDNKQVPGIEAGARDERADIGAMFASEADPEKFCFGADPGDRPLDVKLSRTVEQWAKCDPGLMSKCSQAAVFYALRDAKADILTLAARLRATGRASEAAAGEPVAYVPVHPRTGPLWANTVPTLDSDRPAHYPVRALCYAAPQPASEQQTLTDGDVFTLIGHAENLRGMGQSDMPAWFMGLAERIAETIGDKALADRVRALATKGA